MRLEQHFERHFRYTTELVDSRTGGVETLTALGRFLHGTRAGHCEYFATAGTLVLRHLGIPARYVTGYLVSAAERVGDTCVVRDRQAHAWVRVWVDGAWRDFDPTPSGGLEPEAAPLGIWGEAGRVWSDLRFAMARWWWLGEKRLLRQAYWLAIPLLAGLLWRLRRVREASGLEKAEGRGGVARVWPGQDSEWFGVELRLAEEGWMRRPGEPVREWWRRLVSAGWPMPLVALTSSAFVLHQRLRFDPRGLDHVERDRLRAAVERITEQELPGVGKGRGGATRA